MCTLFQAPYLRCTGGRLFTWSNTCAARRPMASVGGAEEDELPSQSYTQQTCCICKGDTFHVGIQEDKAKVQCVVCGRNYEDKAKVQCAVCGRNYHKICASEHRPDADSLESLATVPPSKPSSPFSRHQENSFPTRPTHVKGRGRTWFGPNILGWEWRD